eukprot:6214578-Pleurochrysis_carterae.AAC.4
MTEASLAPRLYGVLRACAGACACASASASALAASGRVRLRVSGRVRALSRRVQQADGQVRRSAAQPRVSLPFTALFVASSIL